MTPAPPTVGPATTLARDFPEVGEAILLDDPVQSATVVLEAENTMTTTPPNLNTVSEFNPKPETKYHSAPPDPPLFDVQVNGQGFLTKEGKDATREFEKELRALLSVCKTENEVKVFGGILSNLVGNQVADKVLKIKEKEKAF